MANYLDKEKFFQEVVKFNEARKLSPDAQMSDYIGLCIMRICNGLAQRPNFHSYTYIGEMVEDAIEDCIAAIKNFDPAKSSNPYGYCTQVAWFAFVQRIHLEKKQQYLKHKNYQNQFIINDLMNSETPTTERLKWAETSNQIITDFERTMKKSLTKTKNKNKIKEIEVETTNDRHEKQPDDPRDRKKPRRGSAKGSKKPRAAKRAGKSGKNA